MKKQHPNKKLNNGWQEKITKIYKKGGSDIKVRTALNISTSLFYRWLDEPGTQDELTFSKIVKIGRELAEVWWRDLATKNIKNSQFNTSLWIFNMKNRFNWRDKKELSSDSKGFQVNIVNYSREKK